MTSFKVFFGILLWVLPAFPWGSVGHKTVARIAEDNLSPTAMAKIKPLLAGKTLEEISIWPDIYKRNHSNTGPWHYINLPVRKTLSVSDIPMYCSSNGHHPTDNIIDQIHKNIRELKSSNTTFSEKQYALSFLVHLIGDLHMPLHVGDDNDLGGNQKQVRYFSPVSRSNKGHVTNLHSLWDNLIEVKAFEDPDYLGRELEMKITPADRAAWDTGTVEDWAMESYAVAKKTIYPSLPVGPTAAVIPLMRDYHSHIRPICDKQLEKAGVRLAFILEAI